MTLEPHRLADDPAHPELAQALREAQGDVLSPEAVARVRAGLQASGIAATGAASAGAAAHASRSLTAKVLAAATRFRVGLAFVGLALGVAGAASTWPRGSAGRPDPRPPAAPASPAPSAELAVPPPSTEEPPPRTSAPALPTETAAPAGAQPASPAPAVRAGGSARPQAAGAAPSVREGALLLEARSVVDADPARALALVRAHEQEFPRSQLASERARIAAEARRRLQK